MKEFSFPYSEGLNKGLRPNSKNPRNSQYLTEAYNVKMGRTGAEPFVKLAQDIVSPEAEGWATPQVFAASAGNFLGTTVGIYGIDYDFTVSAAEKVTSYYNNASVNWSLADFGQYQVWCDNKWMYYLNPYTGASAILSLFNPYAGPLIGEGHGDAQCQVLTIAAMGGRLFLSGLVEYWDPGGPTLIGYNYEPLDKVFWSRAGGLGTDDLRRITELMTGAEYDAGTTDPNSKPGAGSITLPFNGRIVALKELGNKMMAYVGGSHFGYLETSTEPTYYSGQGGGVAVLTQHASPYPTFGVNVIRPVGVPRGRPVAGDDKRHVFIDSDGVLWTIDANMKLDRLGYEEFFYPRLIESNSYFYLSHDSVNDDYYICSRGGVGTPATVSRTWLLSKNGLSEVHQQVMSVAPMIDGRVSPYPRTVQAICRTNSTDLTGYVCTDTVDMGMRAIKTITGLEIGASNSAAMVANVDYKYSTIGAFTSSVPKPVHKSGIVTPMVAGTDLRVRVKSTSYVDFDLDYMNIRWKLNDKRLIRGLHESTSSKAVPSSGS